MNADTQMQEFMPHGMCFLWNARLLTLHVISDAVIAAAYYSIPLILLYFIRERRDLPFPAVFAMFGVFIVACGTTHVLDIWTIWHPSYWLSGTLKAITAAVSLATVGLLARIVPGALALRSPAELDALNRELTIGADRDRATNAMLREKNRLLVMAEQMAHVGHWRLDAGSNEVYCSDEVYRTCGVPPTTIATYKDAVCAHHPDDREQVRTIVEKAIVEGMPFLLESRIVRPDGTIRQVVSCGLWECTSDGKVRAIFGVFQDVTEAKDAEREREHLIERVRVATESARVGIWDWDVGTGTVVWDSMMFALYGFDDAQFSPTFEKWTSCVHPDDRARTQRELVSGEGTLDTEFRVLWPNGEVHNIRAMARVIRNESGFAQRVIGTNWDITEVRTLADQLQREKDAATFAATHDMLTGLLNRRGLEAWIELQPGLVGTLLYLDIDSFKAVNDRGGHTAGDEILRLVARIIGDAVRDGDGAARMGGDEFLVVLIDVRDHATTMDVISRITSAVSGLFPLGAGDDTRVGISAGVGHLTGQASFADALREADADLYRRKNERSSTKAQADLRRGTGSILASPVAPTSKDAASQVHRRAVGHPVTSV
jgi:diguanylate cyclase (GGDEF)-like protein/PAS domain S-box-containing protein